MHFCKRCQIQFDNSLTHCTQCGDVLYEYVSVAQATEQNARPQPSNGKAIGGMVLSLIGIQFGAISSWFALYALYVIGSIASRDSNIDSLTFGLGGIILLIISGILAVFGTPLSAIGLSMSKRCRKAGNQSASCSIGKTCGMLGLIFVLAPVAISLVLLLVAWINNIVG